MYLNAIKPIFRLCLAHFGPLTFLKTGHLEVLTRTLNEKHTHRTVCDCLRHKYPHLRFFAIMLWVTSVPQASQCLKYRPYYILSSPSQDTIVDFVRKY